MFDSLLVANRGEIASRVIRTTRRLGIKSIAVYSDADAELPYVEEADEAIRLGPAPPVESYLDIARLIDVATDVGAGAVHPGYGFLAENAEFAQAVLDAGVVWVGPAPKVITAMGDKINARNLMASSGVPVERGRVSLSTTSRRPCSRPTTWAIHSRSKHPRGEVGSAWA